MISNNQRKTGKQTYSVDDLYRLARYCVDNNISGNEARKKYFKNNPYQFVFFLRILEGLLDIVNILQIVKERNISYELYITSLVKLNGLLKYIKDLYVSCKLELKETLSIVKKANKKFRKKADKLGLADFEKMKYVADCRINDLTYQQVFIKYAKQQYGIKQLNDARKIILDIKKTLKKTVEEYDELLLSTIIGLF